MSYRCFNPVLNNTVFKPGFKSSLRSLVDKQTCQRIIDKLDLKKKYPKSSNMNIVDVFSGFGLLSTMINQELKPRKHVLIEDHKSTIPHYQQILPLLNTDPKSEMIHYVENGYTWDIYRKLTKEDKIIEPSTQPPTKIHDELLIVAHLLSHSFGESLFAQWIHCVAHRNWLQNYGRVRMICLVPEATAQKFLSGPGFFKRNKSAIKRDVYTDCKLIAINESDGDNYQPDGYNYDPNVLIEDQPIIIPSAALQPSAIRFAVVEVNPKIHPNVNVETLEFVSQILMYRRNHKFFEGLKFVSPGALEDLGPKLEHLADKTSRELTGDDFKEIVDIFEKWPFKPDLEERLALNPESEDDYYS